MASTLPPETRERLDDITRLVIEKLLLTPTEQLKSLSDAETVGLYSEALTRLFGLSQASSTGETESESPSPEARSERSDRRVEPFVRPRKR